MTSCFPCAFIYFLFPLLIWGMYPHTHALWPCLSSLAACKGRGRDTALRRGRWDMQMQTCFPTGAQCQLSLHPSSRLAQSGYRAAVLKAMGLACHKRPTP